jgi:magnesium transporter
MSTLLKLTKSFMKNHTEQATRILSQFHADETTQLFQQFDLEVGQRVLPHMSPILAADVLSNLPASLAARLMMQLHKDMITVIFRRMSVGTRELILESFSPSDRETLRRLLRYPEDTAGNLMDPQVFCVPSNLTVEEVIPILRTKPDQITSYIYVLRTDGMLLGVFTLRELMESRPDQEVRLIMHRDLFSISATADKLSIVNHPGWRWYHALPVVNERNVFLGVIRYKTYRQLLQEKEPDIQQQSETVAAQALGEIYGIGLSGLLEGLAQTVKEKKETGGNRV